MKLLPIKFLRQGVKKTGLALNINKNPFKKGTKQIKALNNEKITSSAANEFSNNEEELPIFSQGYEWLMHKAVDDIFVKK